MYAPSRQRDNLHLQKSIIRHAEGYTQYTYTGASYSPKPMQYYFHKDHLGNVCAAWNATTDGVVQRTVYYSIGVPYDKSGRLVLQQNGNQRARGDYWTVLKYDSYGRPAYTAEVNTRSSDLQDMVDSFGKWIVTEYFSTEAQEYPMGNTGYSREYYHNRPTKLLTVNYYDTYDFLQFLPGDTATALQYQVKSGYDTRHENTVGMLTGTRTYNLSDNRYTVTAYYYDAQGHIIQSRSTSIFSGYNITYTAYNFDGSVRQTISEQIECSDPMREQYTYSYDHVGRSTQVTYELNENTPILLSENIYDEHGQLAVRFRHNRADTTRYACDVRGALTASANSHFTEHLFYGDSLPPGAAACYNGNIAAATITNGDSTHTFGYVYDDYNRLTESMLLDRGQARSSEFFQFDNMGNITRLQRHTLDNRLIDDLLLTYSGNQVTNVTDYAGSLDQYNTKEYHDHNTTTNTIEQQYDANGNLIADSDRGIRHIRYNILNLPDTICFSNGNRIINDYDATGRKWQSQTVTLRESEVITADSGTVFDTNLANISLTQYEGTMERRYTYSRNRLTLAGSMVHNSEGYVEYTYHRSAGTAEMVSTEQIPPRPSVVVQQTQYYYHRNHLGNNCVVWDATNNRIVQRTWYYAGGTPMSNSMAQGLQPYKYNGKEYVEAHGYDVYDYGFRGYYATIGRFTSIDPLCEYTPWKSPYAYANNNWINQIDILGLAGVNLSVPKLNWVAVDNFGEVLGSDMKSSDRGVYLVDDDDWDGTYSSLLDYPLVGWQMPGITYTVGGFYDFIAANLSGMFKAHIGYVAGLMPKAPTDDQSFPIDLRDIIGITDVANTINGDIRCNEFFWFGANGKVYLRPQRHQQGGWAYSYSQAVKRNSTRKLISKTASRYLTIASISVEGTEIMRSGSIKPSNIINLSTTALAAIATIPIVTAAAPVTASIILTATVVYTIADIATGCITGKSIGTHIDELYGGAIYSW